MNCPEIQTYHVVSRMQCSHLTKESGSSTDEMERSLLTGAFQKMLLKNSVFI